MAELLIKSAQAVESSTLSSTVDRPRVIKIYATGLVSVYCASALELNHDPAVVDDTTDMSAVVGWPIPAGAGFEYEISKMPEEGYHQLNVWSDTADAVVIVKTSEVE